MRDFDCRVLRQHILQKSNPGLAYAGLAIGQPREEPADSAA